MILVFHMDLDRSWAVVRRLTAITVTGMGWGADCGMRIWVPAPAGTSLGLGNLEVWSRLWHEDMGSSSWGTRRFLLRKNWQLGNLEVWSMGWGAEADGYNWWRHKHKTSGQFKDYCISKGSEGILGAVFKQWVPGAWFEGWADTEADPEMKQMF